MSSLCYLQRGLPTDLLRKPSPFQDRLSVCPFHICLKEAFFWISLFISFSPPYLHPHFPEGKARGTLAAPGKWLGYLPHPQPPDPLVPTPTCLSWLPQSPTQGTNGRRGPGTQSLQCQPQFWRCLSIQTVQDHRGPHDPRSDRWQDPL